jgi:hypothetical protein
MPVKFRFSTILLAIPSHPGERRRGVGGAVTKKSSTNPDCAGIYAQFFTRADGDSISAEELSDLMKLVEKYIAGNAFGYRVDCQMPAVARKV